MGNAQGTTYGFVLIAYNGKNPSDEMKMQVSCFLQLFPENISPQVYIVRINEVFLYYFQSLQ